MVRLIYTGQLAHAAGVSAEEIDPPAGASLEALVAQLADQRGGQFRDLLLDDAGALRPSILLAADGAQIPRGAPVDLAAAREILVMTPIAGG